MPSNPRRITGRRAGFRKQDDNASETEMFTIMAKVAGSWFPLWAGVSMPSDESINDVMIRSCATQLDIVDESDAVVKTIFRAYPNNAR